MPKVQIQSGDAVHNVELRQGPDGLLLATVDGQTVELDLKNSCNGGLLRIGSRVVPYHTARTGDDIEVWMDGTIHRLQRVSSKARSRAAADAQLAAEILAPMPGTIIQVHVKEGGSFTAHQPLMTMESMKMEITLSAPHAGRVDQLLCKVGELVPMGHVLAKLKPLEDDAPPSKKS